MENEGILRQFEGKSSDTANELRTLKNRLETILEGMTSAEIRKSEEDDGRHCALNETPTTHEFMDSKYSYILPSVEKVIMKITDSDLRSGLEYLLNDYRRMWYRRHSEGVQKEDNLLAEIKMWTDHKGSKIVIPSSLSQTVELTERNKRDLTLRMQKLGDLQKSVAGIKDKFSKVSAEVMSQMQYERDVYGFSFEIALKKVQEMSHDDQEEAESLDDLIKRIDTFEKLMEEQRLRLAGLFKADNDVNEKIHEARKLLSEADAFHNDREKHKSRLETLENDWFRSQEKLFKKLSSYAETIASQLKCHLCIETRNSIIAKESINEYERLLSAEKRYLDKKGSLTFKVAGTCSLLSSVSHPDLIKYANAAIAALNECKDVTLRMSEQTFDRLSRENKAFQSPVTKAFMRTSADNEIESELFRLKYKMKDNTSFPSLIISLFDIINKELKEYVRLLKVHRLRDVQMSTLTHNIDVVALSVARQAVSLEIPTMVSRTPTNSALPRNGRNASVFRLGKIAPHVETLSKKRVKKKDAKRSKDASYDPNAVYTERSSRTLQKNRKPIPKRHGVGNALRTHRHPSEAHQQNQLSLDAFPEEQQQSLEDSPHETISNEDIVLNMMDASEHLNGLKRREKVYNFRTSEVGVSPWSDERF